MLNLDSQHLWLKTSSAIYMAVKTLSRVGCILQPSQRPKLYLTRFNYEFLPQLFTQPLHHPQTNKINWKIAWLTPVTLALSGQWPSKQFCRKNYDSPLKNMMDEWSVWRRNTFSKKEKITRKRGDGWKGMVVFHCYHFLPWSFVKRMFTILLNGF